GRRRGGADLAVDRPRHLDRPQQGHPADRRLLAARTGLVDVGVGRAAIALAEQAGGGDRPGRTRLDAGRPLADAGQRAVLRLPHQPGHAHLRPPGGQPGLVLSRRADLLGVDLQFPARRSVAVECRHRRHRQCPAARRPQPDSRRRFVTFPGDGLRRRPVRPLSVWAIRPALESGPMDAEAGTHRHQRQHPTPAGRPRRNALAGHRVGHLL
ncbi:hypothetical protein XPR_2787, partial [Xanthomonas arboricola pv. pruni MAFF 301420]